jgi:kinesin family protein 15
MEQNIKVIVRLRPAASPSPVHHDDDLTSNLHRDANAALIDQNDPNSVLLMSKPKPKAFSFDYVAGPNSTQYELFQHVGKPITDRCISGYNGTIFAYGQTGSGKTFTMQGPLELNETNWEDRGLIPRILEYLFDRISEIESEVRQFFSKLILTDWLF